MKKTKCKPITFGEGHRDPNSPYNKFKSAIKDEFSGSKTYDGKIEVLFIIFITKLRSGRSDLDNYTKPIIDALHEVRVFKSESQIYKICMEKVDVENEGDEGIIIKLNPL